MILEGIKSPSDVLKLAEERIMAVVVGVISSDTMDKKEKEELTKPMAEAVSIIHSIKKLFEKFEEDDAGSK